MRKLSATFLLLVTSSLAFGQLDLDLKKIGSTFKLSFNKGYVCQVIPDLSFDKPGTLAYSNDEGIATRKAITNCMVETGSPEFHCDEVKCKPIAFDQDMPTISVTKRGDKLGVYFSHGSMVSCVAEYAFGGMGGKPKYFYAEAPTDLEAEVYAQRLCMEQAGASRMHCDVEDCHEIAGVKAGNGGIDIKDLGGLFKKKKKKKN